MDPITVAIVAALLSAFTDSGVEEAYRELKGVLKRSFRVRLLAAIEDLEAHRHFHRAVYSVGDRPFETAQPTLVRRGKIFWSDRVGPLVVRHAAAGGVTSGGGASTFYCSRLPASGLEVAAGAERGSIPDGALWRNCGRPGEDAGAQTFGARRRFRSVTLRRSWHGGTGEYR